MKEIIDLIFSGDIQTAREKLGEKIDQKIDDKLLERKLELVTEMFGEIDYDVEVVPLDEKVRNIQRMGRTKMVRIRIRGGKIQRRTRVSAVKGFTMRGGKLTRMSTQERRRRKMGARRAKFKRRAKLQQALRKRQRSLRRRKAMGL